MCAAVRVPAVVAAAAVLANHGAAGTPGQTLMARIIPAPRSLIGAVVVPLFLDRDVFLGTPSYACPQLLQP